MIQNSFEIGSWLITKSLSVCYFFAFLSLSSQVLGLFGSTGILSIDHLFNVLDQKFKSERYFHVPSLFWLSSSDTTLKGFCLLGMLCSSFAFFGFAQSWMFVFCFVLYLSIVAAGQVFMNYQWDNLLLELGFLGIFFAPFNWQHNPWQSFTLHPLIQALCLLLLFKVVFLSGVVKLSLKDLSWRNLTALHFHFWTQPLPNKFSLLISRLPLKILSILTALVLVLELTLPLLAIIPSQLQTTAALGLIAFQVLIMFTGNFGFFNILVASLCFLSIPDSFWGASFDLTLKSSIDGTAAFTAALVLLPPNLFWIMKTFNEKYKRVDFLLPFMRALAPFRITSAYGLFGVMTKDRPEVILQGSQDGQNWEAYEFKYKPQGATTAPQSFIPHLPRLDWQLWFAANEKFEDNMWLQNLVMRIFDNSLDVLELFKKDPFQGQAPRYLRYQKRQLSLPNHFNLETWWHEGSSQDFGPIFDRDAED